MNDAQYSVLKELIEDALETLETIRLTIEDMRPKPMGKPYEIGDADED